MGATTFDVVSEGPTAKEAFGTATSEARHLYGHGGYTGTIAEKRSFVVIPLPKGKEPRKYAYDLLNNDDPRVNDKWGPAGAISLGDNKWLFFGWASE